MLKLSMKPTGWFQVGWSGQIAPGEAVPMRYFGQDLVAFRGESGRLTILDAHCRHLGAHLGYGGKVRKDCVVCPYHGWAWDEDGANRSIPYQEQPARAKMRKWPVFEQYGIIYLWHDPAGGPPRKGWEIVDLFKDYADVPASEDDYYPAWPLAVVDKPGEPIHPQLIQENAADSAHFRHAHGAPEDPELAWFETSKGIWDSRMGFKSAKTKQVVLTLHTKNPSVGLSYACFDGGATRYRLLLAATPVDEATSHLRVSYFLPRDPTSPDVMPKAVRDFAKSTEELFEQDARIWRHQAFVQRPVFAERDVAGYTALRKFCERFYEAPAGSTVLPELAEA